MSVTDEELQSARELVESKREALAAARAEREHRESGKINDRAYDALLAEAASLDAELAREAEATEKWERNQGRPTLAEELVPPDSAPADVPTDTPPPVVASVPATPDAVAETAADAGNGKKK
jgi:hypothetical protein